MFLLLFFVLQDTGHRSIWECTTHNTTGVINTLFICFASLLALTVYRWYRASVGNDTGNTDNNDSERLLRPSAWYAVDGHILLTIHGIKRYDS